MTLIDRLSKMEGPDFGVNAEIAEMFGYPLHETPNFTASLDATIALAEKVLPGWGFFLRSDKDGHNCGMVYPLYNFVTPGTASGATAAISMCIAILRTKEAKDA